VANDIRITILKLVQHIPSHIIVAGHRTLISYEGQTACYVCNEIGHLYQMCHQRRRTGAVNARTTWTSWSDVAATVKTDPYKTEETVRRWTSQRTAAGQDVTGAHHGNPEVESNTTLCEVDPSAEAEQITASSGKSGQNGTSCE
jgi:hypothetical protein